MTIYPNLLINFPWDFITLYFPLKPLVYFGHCGKAQRSSSCILGGLTLTRPIRAISVTCQGLTQVRFYRIPECIGLLESVFRAIVNRSRARPPSLWRAALLAISWPHHSQEGEFTI